MFVVPFERIEGRRAAPELLASPTFVPYFCSPPVGFLSSEELEAASRPAPWPPTTIYCWLLDSLMTLGVCLARVFGSLPICWFAVICESDSKALCVCCAV